MFTASTVSTTVNLGHRIRTPDPCNPRSATSRLNTRIPRIQSEDLETQPINPFSRATRLRGNCRHLSHEAVFEVGNAPLECEVHPAEKGWVDHDVAHTSILSAGKVDNDT